MTTPRPTLQDLRNANLARLPLFKNCHGRPAHTEPDGSDWSPAQWLQAFVGEVGELAEAIMVGAPLAIQSELADCQIYLDLLLYRILQEESKETTLNQICLSNFAYRIGTEEVWRHERLPKVLKGLLGQGLGAVEDSHAPGWNCDSGMSFLQAYTGKYANFRKKLERGDITQDEFQEDALKFIAMTQLSLCLTAQEQSIDLAAATRSKFNSTSRKLGIEVYL